MQPALEHGQAVKTSPRWKAVAYAYLAAAKLQTTDRDAAQECLLSAELELGSAAYRPQKRRQDDRSIVDSQTFEGDAVFRALALARGALGEPTEIGDVEAKQKLKSALDAAREQVKATPPKEDSADGTMISAWDTWTDLAIAYYRLVDWQGAEIEARLAIELAEDNPRRLLATAPLLLLAGKEAEYRGLCRRLLRDLGSDPADISLIRLCALDLECGGDPERILAEVERLPESGKPWEWRAIGRAYLRAGKLQEAITQLQRALYAAEGDTGKLQTQLCLAIAHHRAGNEPEAKRAYTQARKLAESYLPSLAHYHDRMEAAVLQAEAERLFALEPE